MNHLTLKNFYRILGILTMGQFFLPIVFGNIPFPLSSMLFYLLAWITSLLCFYPRVLLAKPILTVYGFALIYFMLIYAGVFDAELGFFRNEIQALFFAVIILQYHISVRDFKGMQLLLTITLFFICVTIITTLIGLQQYPLAARDLAGILAARDEYALIAFYQSKGIASYGFFSGLAFAIPAFIAFIKMPLLEKYIKYFFVFLCCLSIFGILRAQFTTALLFALMGAGIALWTSEKVKPAMVRIIVLVSIFVLFPITHVADMIYSFAQLLAEGTLQSRLVDLSITLQEGVGATGTHVDRRFDRIPFLLGQFADSPFIGGGESLGHNFWLDRLAMFGLAGIIPWIWLIASQIQANVKRFHKNDRIYYLITMVLFIGMGFMKNMGQTHMMIFVFFIIPGMLIIKGLLADPKRKLYYGLR